MKTIDDILRARGATHGDFSHNARISQAIKRAMLDSPNWFALSDSQKTSLEMISLKIARILSGDNNMHEHWGDIAGYARRVEIGLPGNKTFYGALRDRFNKREVESGHDEREHDTLRDSDRG